MDKELEQDLKDWFQKLTNFDRGILVEYFQRIIDHRGLNEFGFAEDEMAIETLCDFYYPEGSLRQSVQLAAQVFEKFYMMPGAYTSITSPVVVSQARKPVIKDGYVRNVYQLPNKDLLRIFTEVNKIKENKDDRKRLLVRGDGKVFDQSNQRHLIFDTTANSRPQKVLRALVDSKEGLRGRELAEAMTLDGNPTTEHEVSPVVAEVNKRFKEKTGFELIVRNPYRLNRQDFLIDTD